MIGGLEAGEKKGAERADPEGCNKQEETDCDRDATDHVLYSCLGVGITSEARMPDGIMSPYDPH